MRIGDLIARNAIYYPNKLATVYEDVRLTYLQFNERVNKVANAIIKSGYKAPDRVGILSRNSHFYQEIFFGISKTGTVCTTLNWRLSPKELEFIINDAEVKLLFVEDQYWERIKQIKDKLTTVRDYVIIGASEFMGNIPYEEFLDSSSKEEIEVDINPDATFWQLYTSGTTGRPKGVLLTHRNLLADAEHNIIGNKLNKEGGIWLHVFPMFHIALKQLIFVAYTHATVVIMDKFDLKELCELIERERCDYLALAPTMWQFLMDYPDLEKYALTSLRFAFYSTSPMPPSLIKKLIKKFPEITFFSTYGLTEGGSSLTILPSEQHVLEGPDHVVQRLGSLGRPIMGVDVRIVDEKGEDCPPEKIGEIIARGDNIMKGYWKLPKDTEETLKGGWLYTGDMGYWDKYGYIYMADRKKDMIISGGENIYPNEVEQAIREMKEVKDVAVIGVPDEKWGEAVKAVIVIKPNSKLTQEAVINHCAQNISSYKKPKSVDFVNQLPRSATGKVLKKMLRETYWQGRERKV